jgi:DNA-binding response OmpR family regulator
MWKQRVLVMQVGQVQPHLYRGFIADGYVTYASSSEDEVERLIDQFDPELVVITVGPNAGHSIGVIRDIRANSDVPIIVVSPSNSEPATVEALHAGADLFLRDPVSEAVLVAHARALLRRGGSSGSAISIYQDSLITLDVPKHEVTVKGEPVSLSPIEFRLLTALVCRDGGYISHDDLEDRVWGTKVASAGGLRWYIGSLRKKLSHDPVDGEVIVNASGVGYRYSAPSRDRWEAQPAQRALAAISA